VACRALAVTPQIETRFGDCDRDGVEHRLVAAHNRWQPRVRTSSGRRQLAAGDGIAP
jgi:hypothetical protein